MGAKEGSQNMTQTRSVRTLKIAFLNLGFVGLLATNLVSADQARGESSRSTQHGVIALVQYDADKNFSSYEINKRNLTTMADQAIANHADIIVFPEGSMYGYASTARDEKWCRGNSFGCRDVNSIAEAIPGGVSTLYWQTYSQTHKVYVLFNLPEKVSDGVYANTTVVVGPTGYLGKYQKRALYITNQAYAQAGTSEFVLKTPFGNFGLLTCMDAAYPGFLEAYASKVDSVILIMDWDDDPEGPNGALPFFERRAIESGLRIFASDQATWDGTGLYQPGTARVRTGLSGSAIGLDGISYHDL
jgi:predicted amidohydrolase